MSSTNLLVNLLKKKKIVSIAFTICETYERRALTISVPEWPIPLLVETQEVGWRTMWEANNKDNKSMVSDRKPLKTGNIILFGLKKTHRKMN